MRSPFPGMDPYLESPVFWQDLHGRFIPYSCDFMQPQLPDRYRARINERLMIEAVDRDRFFVPDIAVLKRPDWRVGEPIATYGESEVDTPAVITALPETRGETFIEIIDRTGDKVVTVVEFLSPSNKTSGDTRNQYLEKQRACLESGTNLVEIDLLYEGSYTIAAPQTHVGSLRPFHSLISVWRAARPRDFEVYAVHLQRRLPCIGIPLLPEDKDIVLDIQKVFTQCYDNAAYGRDVDYTKPPPVNLPDEESRWVDQHLREAGIRS